jgi:uncharacterized protein (TIGR02246 family)
VQMSNTDPQQTLKDFSRLLVQGDLEGLVELYEPDATFVPQPGTAVSGRAAIRAALVPFVEMQPRLTDNVEKVLLAGDTALVSNRWTLTGTDPEGAPVELSGVSADVFRRRPDGSWGIAVDDPWGGAP